MGKRFTDTNIWDKEWYMNLSPGEKIAFSYIKDKCDNAGVWKPNFKLAEFLIGEKIDWEQLVEKVNGNIEVLDCGKWWIPEFCDFQYGNLVEDSPNRAHQSYVKLLKKHNLWSLYLGAFKGHRRRIDAHKEKDKDKELEKDKEKDKESEGYSRAFEEFWEIYPRKENKKGAYKKWIATKKREGNMDTVMQGAEVYAEECKQKKTDKQYIKLPATFLGPDEHWREYAEKYKPPKIYEEKRDYQDYLAEQEAKEKKA